MLAKIWGFFKKIPNAYYNWKKRNEALSEFLGRCDQTQNALRKIDNSVNNITTSVGEIKEQVNAIEGQVDQINTKIETISEGTKIELFETLHNWRVRLVCDKRWASVEEKKEVKDIYNLYTALEGNGQGTHYYEEIMNLPESEEELKRKEGK